MLQRLWNFLSDMDAQAWRMLAVSFVLFGGVGVVFLFGAQAMGVDSERTLEGWLSSAQGPFALPMAVAAFALLAFIGVPQIVLIAAAVVAFGPLHGAAYSWIGTLVSSLVGFYLGRTAGSVRADGEDLASMKLRFITGPQLDNRRRLLDDFDRFRRDIQQSATATQQRRQLGRSGTQLLEERVHCTAVCR